MDKLTYLVCVALTAVYGIAGVLLVICQGKVSRVIAAAAVSLLIGVFLYPFLNTIATVIAWIIVIGLVLWILSILFG